jgi:hypothetical protein
MQEGIVDDIAVSLIIVAATGIGVIALFVTLNWRKKASRLRLEQAAMQNGWALEKIDEPKVSGYRLSGTTLEGRWILETIVNSKAVESGTGSSSMDKMTVWTCDDVMSQIGTYVFGPAMGSVPLMNSTSLGSMVIQAILKLMLDEDSSWVANLKQMDISDTRMGKRFLAFTDREQELTLLLTQPVEEALSTLPVKMVPVIILSRQGLTLRFLNQQYLAPEELQAILNASRVLAREWSGIEYL